MKSRINLLITLALLTLFSACIKKNENPALGVPSDYTSVSLLRSVYKGADVTITRELLAGAKFISGVVISDNAGNNMPTGVVVLQNTSRGITAGIMLSMDAETAKNYLPGDSLQIDVEGLTLSNATGSLQLLNVDPVKITKVAEEVAITPVQISISALINDFKDYESTLVEVTADVVPVPQPGDTYAGVKNLSDGTVSTLLLNTAADALFANVGLPASATFKGIALFDAAVPTDDGSLATTLRLRTRNDVSYASGPLYAGFPEDFESPEASTKGSYNMTAIDNNIDLKTGNWKLYYSILGTTAGRDRFNPSGKQCIRMQQQLDFDIYLQMNFDLPNGASKVVFSYGSYYNDASSTFQLEYSQDGGQTWQQTGDPISDASSDVKVATFIMDLSGNVRFRVNKLGLGATNGIDVFNGRLSIEDFAVYSN